MRRVVIPRAGSYDRLCIETQPDPQPGPGEVRIAVRAIGVNYADCVVRMGLYASAKQYVGWPITPGFEVAGRISALGDGVQGLALGQPVFAVTRFGGYATELVVPTHQLWPLPAGWQASQAAGFPCVFLTAYHALLGLAHPRVGERLLIHSAAGGVGSALIQLGKLSGCHVVGVVGAPHKVETALNNGADIVIDKSSEPLWPTAERHAPDGYDVVLDANGVATLKQSYAHLAPAGRLVVYGFHTMLPRTGGKPRWIKLALDYLRTPRFNPLQMTTSNRSVLAFNLSFMFDRVALLQEMMGQLQAWISQDRLRPLPLTEYPFERVADAHRDLESAATVGKLILIPEENYDA